MDHRRVNAAGHLEGRDEWLLRTPWSLRGRRSPRHDVVAATVGVEHQVLLEVIVVLARHFAYRPGENWRRRPRIHWDPALPLAVPVLVLGEIRQSVRRNSGQKRRTAAGGRSSERVEGAVLTPHERPHLEV